MIKAVIFDLDGVIVSTDHYHYLAWKKLADELGIYFDEKINERLRGVSRQESLEIVLERSNIKYSESQKAKMLQVKNDTYLKYILTMTKNDVSQEVLDILAYLEENKILKAIGSSSKNALTILKQIELLERFDIVVDGTKIKKSKPDPEVFLKATEMLGLNPSDCLVVEDAIAGVEASINGGIKVLSISNAYGYQKSTYTMKELGLEKFIKIIQGENK